MDSVVQFGFAIIPRGRLRTCSALTSGTTSGTSASIRNAPLLSTAITPIAAAIGAQIAEISSGTSNIATSTPANAACVNSSTITSWPRTWRTLPADRAEANNLISPQTSGLVESRSSITVPTAPVAPTTASVGFFAIINAPSRRKRLLRHQHQDQMLCELL